MEFTSDFIGNSSHSNFVTPKAKLQGNVKQFVLNQTKAQYKRYSNSYDEFSRKTKSQLSHNSTFFSPNKLEQREGRNVKQPNSRSQEITPQSNTNSWLLKFKFGNNLPINHRIKAVSRLGFVKNRYMSNVCKHNPSLDNLKQQLQNLNDSKQLMASQRLRKYHSNQKGSKILRNLFNSTEKQQKTNDQHKLIGKKLPQYSQFIHGQKQYFVRTNLDMMSQNHHNVHTQTKQRVLNQKLALKMVNPQMFKIIKSIFACIIQTLQVEKDSKVSAKKNYRSIQQYCFLYFSNTDKFLIQKVLIQYFLRSFASKLRPFLVYIRFIVYLCFRLSKLRIIYNIPYHNMVSFLIAKALEGQDVLFKALTNAQKGTSNQTGVLQIFKGLKLIKQIDSISKDIKKCLQTLQLQRPTEMQQIESNLKPFLNQSFVLKDSYQRLIRTQMILSWKYLRVPPIPFLPSMDEKYKFTLVSGLQGILINFNHQSRLLKYRNYMDSFLAAVVSHNIQIIAFTKIDRRQADQIIDQIQVKSRYFNYRLYKDHLTFYDGNMIKDYRKLGRDIRKLIIIDSNCDKQEQKQKSLSANTVYVSNYIGQSKSDRSLLGVLKLLIKITEKDTNDVRIELKKQLRSNLYFDNINQVDESQQFKQPYKKTPSKLQTQIQVQK